MQAFRILYLRVQRRLRHYTEWDNDRAETLYELNQPEQLLVNIVLRAENNLSFLKH